MVVKTNLLNIFTLLSLILVLFSFPAFSAIQEVNSTIEKNNFYTTILQIGKDDELTINLTANNSVDVFIFSEQELIDYEVNKIIKPSYLSRFKLNTTFFQVKNFTIAPYGTYYIVVDNTDNAPNRGKTNNSIILQGTINISSINTGTNFWPPIIFLILIIIIIVLIFIYLKYSNKWNAPQTSYFFFIIVVVFGFFIMLLGSFTKKNYDSSVSASLLGLMQILVSLLTILFTLTLILAQILAQTYPHQITKYIFKQGYVIGLFIYYLITIVFGIYNIIVNNTSYWIVSPFIFLSITIIVAIIPFTFLLLEELSPRRIIKHFIKAINRKNVLLTGGNLGEGDRGRIFSDIEPHPEDTLQPISDIAQNAISRQNHEVIRIVISDINIKFKELISENTNEDENKKLTKNFCYHLFHIGKSAISNRDVESLDLITKTFKNMSEFPNNEFAINELIVYLNRLGIESAINGFVFIAYDIIGILKNAGMKCHNRVTLSSMIGITEVGKVLINNKSVSVLKVPIVEDLGDIILNLVRDIEINNENLERFKNITFLGKLPINYKTSSNLSLEDIVMKREEETNNLIQDILINIKELRDLEMKYEVGSEVASLNILNQLINNSDNETIKDMCNSQIEEITKLRSVKLSAP